MCEEHISSCGRSPIRLFARTFSNFGHSEGVRIALGQTWFAHMQEPFTRIPSLVLTQKWRSAPMLGICRTRDYFIFLEYIKLSLAGNGRFALASFSVRYPFRSTSSVSNTSSSCSGSNSSIWPLLKHRSMSRLVMKPFPSWSHVLNRASQSKMSMLYSLSPFSGLLLIDDFENSLFRHAFLILNSSKALLSLLRGWKDTMNTRNTFA